jgi:beta-N-acetylhexosaminidase
MSSVIRFLLFVLYVLLSVPCSPLFAQVKIGAEVFFEKNISLVAGKRVGVLCNSASIVFSENKNLVDVLREKKINVTAIFSPEHGFRNNISAGEKFGNQFDSATGITIFSLYGKTYKPTKEMLDKIDVLLFDLQDVGARYFTYSSTMAYAMEACSENGKQFILFDRPNPIGGNDVEGFLLEDSLQSFVGKFPIPNRHGVTLGELAQMIVGEKWITNSEKSDLKIIPCEGLTRAMYRSDIKLPWNAPSPNIISPTTALVYVGTCVFEGTNISEGRGTEFPFQTIGAPWIGGKKLVDELEKEKLENVKFSAVAFTPHSNPKRSTSPKFMNENCGGIFIEVTDEKKFQPLNTSIAILCAIKKLYPDSLHFNTKQFARLAGTVKLQKEIEAGKSADEIEEMWNEDVKKFLEKRKKYLLYK